MKNLEMFLQRGESEILQSYRQFSAITYPNATFRLSWKFLATLSIPLVHGAYRILETCLGYSSIRPRRNFVSNFLRWEATTNFSRHFFHHRRILCFSFPLFTVHRDANGVEGARIADALWSRAHVREGAFMKRESDVNLRLDSRSPL